MTLNVHRHPLLTSIALLVGLPLAVSAAPYTWTGSGSTNNWSNPLNWNPGAPNPVVASNAITFAGTTRLNTVLDFATPFQIMSLNFSSIAGAFTISNSTLNFQTGTAAPTIFQFSANNQTINSAVTLSNDLVISGSGTGNLTLGGSVSGPGGLTKTSAGKLTLTGASTYTGSTRVDAGTLELVPGGSILNSFPQIAPGATLLISGGSIDSGTGVYFSVGSASGAGPATVTQTSGTVQATAMDVGNAPGSTGVYNQSGGTTTVPAQLTVGLNAGTTGTYNLSGTGTLNTPGIFTLGVSSTGTFNQTGGTLNASQVNIGRNASGTGTYVLSAGAFTASNYVAVGIDGNGTVKQSGGTMTTPGTLYVGFNPTSAGIYELSGGTALVGDASIGQGGAGSVVQTGGLMSVAETLTLGTTGSGVGSYRLSGGVVRTKRVSGGVGTSTFSFDGGTLQTVANTSDFITGIDTLQVLAGGARIDTNGYFVTIGASLAHDTSEPGGFTMDGGLTKAGAGDLALTAANTFNGGVTVAEGTLTVSSDANLGASSGPVTLMNGGALNFLGNSFATSRPFILSNSVLTPPANGTITYNGSTISGGALGQNGPSSAHEFGGGVTVNGTTVLPGTKINQATGTVALNNVTLSGALNQSGGTLVYNGGYISPAANVSIGGTMNTSGVEVTGRLSISGTVNNSTTPLVLGYGASAIISSTGQLNALGGSSIEVNGAQLINRGVINGVLNINHGSTAIGSGNFGTATVQSGATFSPGNGIGSATFTSLTLAGGSTILFELNSATANAGVNQDFINITDSLSLGTGGPITLRLVGLAAGNTPSPLSDFSTNTPYTFTLATSANVINGFSANQFVVDTSDFGNALNGGLISVQESADQKSLLLTFVPVPEPSTLGILAAASALLGAGRFRRRGGA